MRRGPLRIAHERPDVRRRQVLEEHGDERPADEAVRARDRDAHR